jgi:hypothetical protein
MGWRILSLLLHPIWLPMASAFLLFGFNPFFLAHFNTTMALRVVGSIGFATAFVPGLLLLMMRSLGWVETLELEQRSDRKFLLFAALVCQYFCFQMLRTSLPSSYLDLVLIGGLLLTGMSFLINLFFKISLHAVGWGGLTGMIMGFGPSHLNSFFPLLCGSILLGGLVLSARRALGAHRWVELGLGYALGIGVFSAYFLYLYFD